MAKGEIHEEDRTLFLLTIKDEDGTVVDVSGASTKKVIFEKPDDSTVAKDAEFYMDGTDGIIKYEAEEDFLTAGDWRIQGYVIISSKKYSSDIRGFRVKENL